MASLLTHPLSSAWSWASPQLLASSAARPLNSCTKRWWFGDVPREHCAPRLARRASSDGPIDTSLSGEEGACEGSAEAGAEAEGAGVCATEQGKVLEQSLRDLLAGRSPKDSVGRYRVVASKAVVGDAATLGEPPFVAELPQGAEVEVVEVQVDEGTDRVRGRIAEPAGWISLQHAKKRGLRWAEKCNPFDAFDAEISALARGLGDAVGEFAGELQCRMRSDLLYLSALRAYAQAGLRPLASLEGPSDKTWTMIGADLDKWRKMAEEHAHDVSLGPAQDRRDSLLGGRAEYAALVSAFATKVVEDRAPAVAPGAVADSSNPFVQFLERFFQVRNEILISIGGASGMPSSNSSVPTIEDPRAWGGGIAEGSPEDPLGERKQQEAGVWLPWLGLITENLRVANADAYFGNALFGLCLRRVAKRFELERSMGMLQAPSETSLAWVQLYVGSAVGEEKEKEEEFASRVAVAQFADFVGKVSSLEETSTLEAILDLSRDAVEAIRRQTDFVFGASLRDELQRVTDRAKEQWQSSGETPVVVATSLMLEAANTGELRMMSVDLAAREQLTLDGILYGSFLQRADDAIERESALGE